MDYYKEKVFKKEILREAAAYKAAAAVRSGKISDAEKIWKQAEAVLLPDSNEEKR